LSFLNSQKPIIKELISLLMQKFEYASVLGTDVQGKRYFVSSKITTISDNSWAERGFVVRVYKGGRYFEYSVNEIEDIHKITKEITDFVDISIAGDYISYPKIVEQEIMESFNKPVKYALGGISPEKIIHKLRSIVEKAYTITDKLVDFRVVLSTTHVSKIFISDKKDLCQDYTWSEGYHIALVRGNNATRQSSKSFSGLKGLELIDVLETGVDETVESALKLLDAKTIVPGEYDVVFAPGIVGIIVHEAFGHGVEMDMFVKGRAKAIEYLNKEVASPLINMRDGAKSCEQVSSYLFDDEGTLGSDTLVIENGVLKAGISDLLSALKLGSVPTGNGKRQNFEQKAYSRMTNTFFERGDSDYHDMIKSIKHGFFIEKASSGMEDPKDWGIQVMAVSAIEIIDGKLTDNIYAPIVLTGYVPDLLKSISMVSGDFEMYGSGACGKGYKEWAKVSDGGPYIKAKARLG
jgi:TldD protein